MPPKDHSLGLALTFSGAGLTIRIITVVLPRAALDVAGLIGLAIFVLCVVILGYAFAAAITRALRL